MFRKSKLGFIAIAALLLAGCGGGGGDDVSTDPVSSQGGGGEVADYVKVDITDTKVVSTVDKAFKPDAKREKMYLSVWSEVASHALFMSVVGEFTKDFAYDPDNNVVYEFTVTFGDEFTDTATNIAADLSTAPNVFGFPDDHVSILYNAGALAELTGSNKRWAEENNVASAVSGGTINGKLYSYPQTADNGIYLYYNNDILSLEDVASWDSIIDALKAHSETRTDGLKSKIIFPFGNGYYNSAFFIGKDHGIEGAEPVFAYDPATTTMTTTINDERGQNAVRGMERILHTPGNADYIIDGDVDGSLAKFSNKDADGNPIVPEILVGVSGYWNVKNLVDLLGDSISATKLPTFTPVSAEGELLPQMQMGSLAGSKQMGVLQLGAAEAQKEFFSHQIAQYLTREDTQIKRYPLGFGPSNIKALEDPSVKEDIFLAALAEQGQFAIAQSTSVSGTFWEAAEAFGAAVVAGEYAAGTTVVDYLDAFAEAIAPENPI